MRDKIHYKFQYRASVLAIASCLSLSPLLAEAAGMGKITVFSGLGQPLRAEVDVSGTNEELATMAARLAPSESFDQAGIYYGSALKDLRFSLEKKGSGQGTIKITSARPINDPFLDFLIELNWASGRLVREYTFLLDPLEVAAKTTNRPIAVVDAKPVAQLSGGSDRPADPRPGAAATPSSAPIAVVSPPLPATKPVEIPTSRPLTRVPTEPAPLPTAAPKLDTPKPVARLEEPTPIAKVTPKVDTRVPTEPVATTAAPLSTPTSASQGETQLWPPMPGKRLSSLSGGPGPMSTPTPTSSSSFLPPVATPAPISRVEPMASPVPSDSRSEVRLWPPEDKKRDAKAVSTPASINNTPLPPLATKAPEPVAPSVAKSAGGAAGTHEVQRGDTLRKIADDTRPEGVSLEQMLVGLYRNNSDAFIGNNINRLRTGAVLTVPDKDAASSIPQDEARRIYRAQVAQWNTYRQKLAGAAADNNKDDVSSQASGGSVTAKVEEKAAPEPAKDQVKVSRTEGSGKGGKDAARAAALEEELVTKSKAVKEGQERIAALEKNVSELQKLVEMKNQSLADLQKQQAAKAAEPPPAPKPVEAPKAPEPVKPAEPPKVEEPKPAEPPKAEEAPKPAEPAPPPVEAPKPAAPKPPPPPEPEPEEEAGLLDGIIASVAEDPVPLAAGGGVLALLLGFMAYRRRRQANAEAPLSEAPSSYQPSTLGPNSVYHSTGGQSINTSQTPPPLTDFSQAGPGTIDTDEVDPVAEADVYMAYGRDAQAEEILVEALQKDPQRTAVHLKLLEIYSNRRDIKQFETVASELYAQTGGKGPDWEKAVAMGVALDPSNPLFGGRQASPQPQPVTPPPPPPPVFEAPRAPAAPQAPAATATSMGLDFDLGASSLAPPQVPVAPPPPPPPPPAPVAPKPAPKPDFATTTLTGAVSLRFTQPTSTPPAQAAATAENSFTPEGTLIQSRETAKADMDMNDLDFDLGSNSSLGFAESATATEASEAFDFDIKLTESALRGQELPTNSFDMSSINLDLDAPAISDAATEHGPQWEEVNTKLDLAKAYEEMGDMEGARELLQEVLNEGEADQIAQAKGIMDRLAAG